MLDNTWSPGHDSHHINSRPVNSCKEISSCRYMSMYYTMDMSKQLDIFWDVVVRFVLCSINFNCFQPSRGWRPIRDPAIHPMLTPDIENILFQWCTLGIGESTHILRTNFFHANSIWGEKWSNITLEPAPLGLWKILDPQLLATPY